MESLGIERTKPRGCFIWDHAPKLFDELVCTSINIDYALPRFIHIIYLAIGRS